MICFQLDGCNASGHKWAETGLRGKAAFPIWKQCQVWHQPANAPERNKKNEIDIDFKKNKDVKYIKQ